MATCVVDVHFVGCTQPSPKEPAHVSKPNPKNPSKRQRIESGHQHLFILDQSTAGGPYKKTKSLRMN